MTALEIAVMLKNEFYHYYHPNVYGETKSLLQIEGLIQEIMDENIRHFVEAQKKKKEVITVKKFMRKTDKRRKPKLEKLDGNKIKTLKVSKEEIEEAQIILEKVKAQNQKAIKLPQGFCYNFQPKKIN